MPPRYKTVVPASASTSTPFVVVASVSSSSSSAPPSSSSLTLDLVCQSPSWPAPPGFPSGFLSVVAIVAFVVVAVQRLRAAVHSRRHASRAVSSMSRAPAQPRVQPYDDQLPRPSQSQSPQRTPSQKRRGQPRASTSSISYSRPLVTVPLATSDRQWPPPPPMPTLAMLQWPAPDTSTPGARDEYYSPSPDQYDNQYQYAYPPVSAAPYPPSMGSWSPEQLKRSAELGPPPRFFSGPPPSSSYTYPPPYPLGPLPRAETTVLPPPPRHPNVTDALRPGPPFQPQIQPHAEGRPDPPSPPPPQRGHRRSYSQKIIYPKSYSPSSQSTSRSAPELGRNMRDADPLTTPGGTTASRGLEGPDGEAMGIEVSEEIIVAAEGWRRHTRVYGGGVCMACLESEAEMKERGMNLDVGPILMEGSFDPRSQQAGESAPLGSMSMLGVGRSEDKGKGREDDGGRREEIEGTEGRGGVEGESEQVEKMKEGNEDWWRQATTLEEKKGEREDGGDSDHKSPRDEPDQAGKTSNE